MTYQDLLNRVDDLRLLAVPPVPGEASGCMSSYDRRSRYEPDTDTYDDWSRTTTAPATSAVWTMAP